MIGWTVGWQMPKTCCWGKISEAPQWDELGEFGIQVSPYVPYHRVIVDATRAVNSELVSRGISVDVARTPSRRRGIWLVIVEERKRPLLRSIVRFGRDGFSVEELVGHTEFSHIVDEIRRKCDEILAGTIYLPAVAADFVRVIKRRGGFHLSKTGGTYFVPYTHENERLLGLWRGFVEHVGGVAIMFAVVGSKIEVEAVMKLLVRALNDYVEDFKIRMGRKMREETFAVLMEDIKGTLQAIALYRTLLGVANADLDEIEAHLRSMFDVLQTRDEPLVHSKL